MKVLVLPKDGPEGSYKLIKLPLAKNIQQTKSYLLQDNVIYELKEINGNNPHVVQPSRPQLKNGDGVKSWIFEGDPGFVVQSGNLIVATKFNIVYLLISIFYTNVSKFTQRFIAFEDLLDQMTSLYGDWINEIPTDVYLQKLPDICEIIDQDDENYYKFSLVKANTFIQEKVNSFLSYISSKPNSIANLIKAKMTDPASGTIPENIIESAQSHHALEFVTNSYCLPAFKEQYIAANHYDFSNYIEYQSKLKEQQKSREIVDATVNNIAVANANVPKKKPAAKKTAKKQTTKVAVGKGALDGFFGKK